MNWGKVLICTTTETSAGLVTLAWRQPGTSREHSWTTREMGKQEDAGVQRQREISISVLDERYWWGKIYSMSIFLPPNHDIMKLVDIPMHQKRLLRSNFGMFSASLWFIISSFFCCYQFIYETLHICIMEIMSGFHTLIIPTISYHWLR